MAMPHHYTDCGLDYIYLENGFETHGEAVLIQAPYGLHCAIASFIIRSRKSLTGEEFQFLRTEMHLSQKKMAALMGVTDQSVRNWERAEWKKNPLPGPADRLLRLYYLEHTEGKVSVRAIVENLDRLAFTERQPAVLFSLTAKGWVPSKLKGGWPGFG
jgi:putative transcriptional regulator